MAEHLEKRQIYIILLFFSVLRSKNLTTLLDNWAVCLQKTRNTTILSSALRYFCTLYRQL